MPKVRSLEYSFIDAQKHLSVGRARLTKIENNLKERNTLISKIDDVMRTIQSVTKDVISFKESEYLSTFSTSLLDKAISTENDLILKELKKDETKIDYKSAIRAIYNCTDRQKAFSIGVKYNLQKKDVYKIMAKAPINTNLGKVIAEMKIQVEEEKKQQLVNGQLVNGQLVNGQLVNGQLANGQLANGQLAIPTTVPAEYTEEQIENTDNGDNTINSEMDDELMEKLGVKRND